MNLSESEVLALNSFLNGAENLPVEVEALNVKLRESLGQDNSVVPSEVEAAVEAEADAEAAVAAPVEETPAPEAEPTA